jgi:hypothetical protein
MFNDAVSCQDDIKSKERKKWKYGSYVERYRQGKPKISTEKSVPMSRCPNDSYECKARERIQASQTTGRRQEN